MGEFDEIFDEILGDEWSNDGFGPFDSNLIHNACGTMIEPDAPRCPVDGAVNPLVAQGLI